MLGVSHWWNDDFLWNEVLEFNLVLPKFFFHLEELKEDNPCQQEFQVFYVETNKVLPKIYDISWC